MKEAPLNKQYVFRMVRFDRELAAFKMVTNEQVHEVDDLTPSIGEKDRHQFEPDRHPSPLSAEEYQQTTRPSTAKEN